MTQQNLNKPRLYVFKSNKHIYAQIIDPKKNQILTSSSTLTQAVNNNSKYYKNCETARAVGENIANKLKKLGINEIIFDRGQNIYHGQVKALADATRNQGIIF